MRLIKLFVISAIALFLLLFFFSALLPANLRVSRAIDILAPNTDVQAEMKNVEGWKNWNEFIKVLPDDRVKGDTIISNTLTINLQKVNNRSIETRWVQQNGKSFPSVFNIIRQDSVTTTLQWYFDFTFKWYPWEKFSSMVYDKQLGPQMEQSLLNLKQLLEKAQ